MNISERPLSIEEFAEKVGLHYITIWRACRRGEINCDRLGRKYLIPRKELTRYQKGSKPTETTMSITSLDQRAVLEGGGKVLELPASWLPQGVTVGDKIHIRHHREKNHSQMSISKE